MRQERTVQGNIFEVFASHEIGEELKAMSGWLDEHCNLLALVTRDLSRVGVKATGRRGLPAEAVLRCALLKQYRQISYEELSFHLEDSASFRAFARLPLSWSPKKSVLQRTISSVRSGTWEEINRVLLSTAQRTSVESGDVIRIDSTVTAALIHEPTDSSLLWDATRVMTRLLRRADELAGGRASSWCDHRRAAKKRARNIKYARGKENRVAIYRELIPIVRKTLRCLDVASKTLSVSTTPSIYLWRLAVQHYRPLIAKILDQTERRVLRGESVPASEKLVRQRFEP